MFYRVAKQHDGDVLFQSGHQLTAIEIKSSKVFHRDVCRGIRHLQSIIHDRVAQPCSDHSPDVNDIALLHYQDAWKAIEVK